MTSSRLSALVVVLAFSGAGPLAAQSLVSSGGLGVPTDGGDARSRMLGGVGVSLSGAYLLPGDPAAAAGIRLPGISATLEVGTESPEDGTDAGRSRFPAFGIVYPYRNQALFATFSGVLAQEWRSEVDRTLQLGDSEVRVRDRFDSRGGISAARVGWARRVGERFSVGVSAGSHVGSLERTFVRELNPEDVGPEVEPFGVRGTWSARGPTLSAGAHWDVTPLIRVGGAVGWSGDLTLTPVDGTEGESLRVPMPLDLRLGTFATLTPGLGLAASVQRADWSSAARALGDENAPGVTWQWGAGVEWSGESVLGRRAPVGLGYRQRDLPFSFLGGGASESAFTGGIGIHLADADATPLARLDVGLERGSRSAGVWEESFWRTTVTLRLSGR
jgi:hypothetical protein